MTTLSHRIPLVPVEVAAPAHRDERPPGELAGKHVFCVGIGGCGMSGLARMLRSHGAIVRGSDKEHSQTTSLLDADGFNVDFDQSTKWLPEQCDLVVRTAAGARASPSRARTARAQQRRCWGWRSRTRGLIPR